MDDETLAALKGSIAKWEGIVAGTAADQGERNCPLCQQFPSPTCNGCPVKERTGRSNCSGTPYHGEWMRLSEPDVRGCGCGSCKGERIALTDVGRAAAQAELDFLISLLPPGETP
jgi:hypothetical protein